MSVAMSQPTRARQNCAVLPKAAAPPGLHVFGVPQDQSLASASLLSSLVTISSMKGSVFRYWSGDTCNHPRHHETPPIETSCTIAAHIAGWLECCIQCTDACACHDGLRMSTLNDQVLVMCVLAMANNTIWHACCRHALRSECMPEDGASLGGVVHTDGKVLGHLAGSDGVQHSLLNLTLQQPSNSQTCLTA